MSAPLGCAARATFQRIMAANTNHLDSADTLVHILSPFHQMIWNFFTSAPLIHFTMTQGRKSNRSFFFRHQFSHITRHLTALRQPPTFFRSTSICVLIKCCTFIRTLFPNHDEKLQSCPYAPPSAQSLAGTANNSAHSFQQAW